MAANIDLWTDNAATYFALSSGSFVYRYRLKHTEGRDYQNGDKAYAFLVHNNKVERRAIATGGERGKEIIVISGISAGEKVIINAPSDLADGVSVKETKR